MQIRLSAVAITAVVAAVLAGCGSENSGGSGSGAGAPIKIMSWAPLANPKVSAPQVKSAAEARVRAINDAGGINGRKVELVFCDSNYDPNTEAGCARQAQQEQAVAVVGAYTTFPGTYEVLERAKIPVIGSLGLLEQELASPVVYPLAGGVPGWFAGAVMQLKKAGAETVGLIGCNSPACSYATQIVKDVVPRAGMRLTGEGDVQVGAPDPSAAVAQAIAGDPDGLVIAVPPSSVPKVVQAVQQANYAGTISSASSLFPPTTVRALGSAADGILLTSQIKPLSATTDPAIVQFGKELDALDADAKKDETAEFVWGSFLLFEKLAGRLDTVDAAAVSTAMSDLSDPIDIGITAPYVTAGKTSPVAGAPRLFNPTVYYDRIENGTVVATSDAPVNPFTELTPRS